MQIQSGEMRKNAKFRAVILEFRSENGTDRAEGEEYFLNDSSKSCNWRKILTNMKFYEVLLCQKNCSFKQFQNLFWE